MAKESAQTFLFTQFAQDLWKELCDQFGQMSGPMLFQIYHEILNIRQGNQLLTVYYNKLKKYWDELQALNSYPT